ncbi:MAG: 1-acyl-sn-glycerol-3-phosphate acyltransferase [Pseudomonadota bacterium]
MKSIRRLADATLGRWVRHIFFILLRSYYGLFFNISCANKALLQDLPGGLILCTHGSRHDGPMIAAMLYTTRRVRPAVGYEEYYNPVQWFPLMIAGCVPMSSPKTWSKDRRAAQKERALTALKRIIENGNLILLYPAGRLKQQRLEVIEPHFSGAYDTLRALPPLPVTIIRIRGLSKHEPIKRDLFWTFIGRQTGRRHIHIDIERLEGGLDTERPLAEFNADLEARFNTDLLAEETPKAASEIAPPSRQ